MNDSPADTNFERYVADPAERPRTERLARWRPLLAWLSALLIFFALASLWFRGSGTEDPSLDVPAEQLTTPAAPAPEGGEAPPAEPAPEAPAP